MRVLPILIKIDVHYTYENQLYIHGDLSYYEVMSKYVYIIKYYKI